MTVTVNHAKTNAISDWTQAQLDEQIALGNFPAGTTLANIVLPSDWNDDHTLTGLGTMAEQNANSVAITGGSVNGTTIGATTASTGKFTSVTTPSVTATTNDLTLSAISTGNVNLNTAGGTGLRVSDVASSVRYVTFNGATSSGSPGFFASAGSLAQSSGATSNINFYTNLFAQEQMRVSHTASAVNYVQVTGAATGGQPTISAQGSDAAVDLTLNTKSTGTLRLQSNSTTRVSINSGGTVALGISASGGSGLQVIATGSQVNFTTVLGSVTGQIPTLSMVNSSDTNVGLGIVTKGTGAIDLAAGSSGVNISNGGTVTAITRTGAGSGYTTPPTVAITAPTTAGGVQATATVTIGLVSVTSVANGGTGYTVGNTLTVVGGTSTVACQVTVTTVSSGVITGVSVATGGSYTVAPTNPVSVTGGSGSGATFNLSFCIGSTFTITAAGSGYIEQPTITFSGGGGSGAAAYATVGSNTVQKTLANSHTFSTPNSSVLALVDKNASSGVPANTTVAFSMVPNQTNFASNFFGSSAPLYFGTASSSTTDAFNFATSVGTPVSNGGGGSSQFRIVHTASAVNYVQVTGAATTGTPIIQAQGSDTNVSLAIRARGGGNLFFQPNSLNQFAVIQTASAVNYLQATGSAAGVAPAFSVAGSDTNIDLALTPKGTGLVRFGTYVAGALLATGYINIKAADGTTYKVLVST